MNRIITYNNPYLTDTTQVAWVIPCGTILSNTLTGNTQTLIVDLPVNQGCEITYEFNGGNSNCTEEGKLKWPSLIIDNCGSETLSVLEAGDNTEVYINDVLEGAVPTVLKPGDKIQVITWCDGSAALRNEIVCYVPTIVVETKVMGDGTKYFDFSQSLAPGCLGDDVEFEITLTQLGITITDIVIGPISTLDIYVPDYASVGIDPLLAFSYEVTMKNCKGLCGVGSVEGNVAPPPVVGSKVLVIDEVTSQACPQDWNDEGCDSGITEIQLVVTYQGGTIYDSGFVPFATANTVSVSGATWLSGNVMGADVIRTEIEEDVEFCWIVKTDCGQSPPACSIIGPVDCFNLVDSEGNILDCLCNSETGSFAYPFYVSDFLVTSDAELMGVTGAASIENCQLCGGVDANVVVENTEVGLSITCDNELGTGVHEICITGVGIADGYLLKVTDDVNNLSVELIAGQDPTTPAGYQNDVGGVWANLYAPNLATGIIDPLLMSGSGYCKAFDKLSYSKLANQWGVDLGQEINLSVQACKENGCLESDIAIDTIEKNYEIGSLSVSLSTGNGSTYPANCNYNNLVGGGNLLIQASCFNTGIDPVPLVGDVLLQYDGGPISNQNGTLFATTSTGFPSTRFCHNEANYVDPFFVDVQATFNNDLTKIPFNISALTSTAHEGNGANGGDILRVYYRIGNTSPIDKCGRCFEVISNMKSEDNSSDSTWEEIVSANISLDGANYDHGVENTIHCFSGEGHFPIRIEALNAAGQPVVWSEGHIIVWSY